MPMYQNPTVDQDGRSGDPGGNKPNMGSGYDDNRHAAAWEQTQEAFLACANAFEKIDQVLSIGLSQEINQIRSLAPQIRAKNSYVDAEW